LKKYDMAATNKTILSTRPLPKSILDEAAANGIDIEELSFIRTEAVTDEHVTARIAALSSQKITAVFTSMNAVEAVAAAAEPGTAWQIYALGQTTQKLVTEKLPASTIVATAENAARLGERLIDDGVQDIVFFCGNIRRDELPNKMRSEKIGIEELVVYETHETPSVLTRDYDGILFFSPSAVQAFFSVNKPSGRTVLFAIGKTTAEAIRQHWSSKMIVAHATGKADLAREAIAYFTT
jgi:uroporphyrinogen-III synthase